MTRKYYLYIYIPKYKYYHPIKIYSSKQAALRAIETKYICTSFKLERLNKFDPWKHDKVIYYKAVEDEHGNMFTSNGYYVEYEE